MRDHRKLDAFQLADQLVDEVYKATSHFPSEERFLLTSQIRRAGLSTAINIVEGSARESQGDYRRFLNIAFASARELQYELSVAERLGYIQKKDYERIDSLVGRTCAALHSLQLALQKSLCR